MAEETIGTDVNQTEVTSLNHIKGNPHIVELLRTSLDAYFQKRGVSGMTGVDTRALTRHIRTSGAVNGILSTDGKNLETLVNKAKSTSPTLSKISRLCRKPQQSPANHIEPRRSDHGLEEGALDRPAQAAGVDEVG